MSFMLGATARGADNQSASEVKVNKTKTVVLSDVTGSRIPQHVVRKGRQVNSASPLYVVQGNDLLVSGSVSVAGILANDPNISTRRAGIH
jgi:hypothetical protein